MKKNILLASLLAGSSLSAMHKSPVGEPRHGLVKTTKQTSSLVKDIVVQVQPSYVRGGTLFDQRSEVEISLHESALCKIGQATSMSYLTPIKDLGIYYVSFKYAVDLFTFFHLCKLLPGFEALHDVSKFNGDDATTREALFAQRIKELSQAKDPVAFEALEQFAKEETQKLAKIEAVLLLEQLPHRKFVSCDVRFEGAYIPERLQHPTMEELDERLAIVDAAIELATHQVE